MFLFVAVIFLTNSLRIIALSDSGSDLFKYRTDLDQIGNDVENFFYDVTKDVLKGADKFVGIDYSSGYDDDVKDESETVKTKIKKGKIQGYTTPATVNVIEDYTGTENERKRRSIFEDYPSENILATAEKPDCIEKAGISDDQSLNEIKQELRKLTELTILLKDQQKILSELNKEGKNDLSDDYDPQDLIQLLKSLEKDRKITKPKAEKQKTFDKLEIEIRKAISAINKTNDEWKIQKGRELNLETQIKQQKDDIVTLKTLVKQLLNQSHVPDTENNESTDKFQSKDIKTNDEIVGLPLFLPHPIPKFQPTIESQKHLKINNTAKERSNVVSNVKYTHPITSNTEMTEKFNKEIKKDEVATKDKPNKNEVYNTTESLQPRASSAEKDISKFFDEIIEPHNSKLEDHNSKLEDKIRELEVQLNKENKEKAVKKELFILRKLLKEERDKPTSKSLLEDADIGEDEDIQFLRRLQTAMKAMDKESSKPPQKPEIDIETRLQELQIAIDNLRPKEDATLPVHKNLPQNKSLSDEQPSQLSVDQLKQLRIKIDELLQKEKSDNDHIIPSSSTGLSFPPQTNPNLDSIRGLLPYPLWNRGQQYLKPMGPPFFDFNYQPNNPYYYSDFPQIPLDWYKPMGTDPTPTETPKLIEPSEIEFRNQFFPAPQSLSGRNFREFGYYPEEPAGYGLPQPGHYQTEVNYNDLKKNLNVNDLKSEIFNLENILSTMSTPQHHEKVGDKGEVEQLERQVKGLKVMINSITDIPMYPQPSPTNMNYRSTRSKRSIESTYPSNNNQRQGENPQSSNTQVDDSVTSKLRQYFLEEDNKARSAHYNELKDRLNRIKFQLEEAAYTKPKQIEYWPFEKYQETSPIYPIHINQETRTIPSHTFDLDHFGKEDIFTNIIVRIVGKIIAAVPQILGKLFGIGIHSLFDKVDKTHGNEYGNSYGYTYDNNYGVSNNNYNLQSVFSKLGIFGYIPIVILNIINAITTICKLIRKNKFFTNFIVPILVLLLVAGGVVFLIWWLQPDNDSTSVNQIESVDKYAASASNYLYNDSDRSGRYAGTNYNLYRYYRTPWYENYLRNLRNVDGRAIMFNGASNVQHLPLAYYRSYFDDGSKRV